MSKLILGLVGILGAFMAQAVTPEGQQLACLIGKSPVPLTGFRPSSLGRVEMKVRLMPESETISALFCARKGISDLSQRFAFGLFTDADKWHFHYKDTIYQPADTSIKKNVLLELSLSAKGGIVVNGQQVLNSTVKELDFETGGDMVLLGAPNVSGVGYANEANYTFYWAKIYDATDQLVASLVPWKVANDDGEIVLGVLDELSGNFYACCEILGHRLNWCASNGSGQVVDTGFVPPSRGRIEARFALTPPSWPNGGGVIMFGARQGSQERALRRAFAVGVDSIGLIFHYNDDVHEQIDRSLFVPNREMTLSVSAKDGIFIDGMFVEGSNVGAADFTVGESLVIFGFQGLGADYSAQANMRFYGMKVFDENNLLLASFVPWMDGSGVVGVCDELSWTFHAPQEDTKLYAGRTLTAEMTGPKTAKVTVSAVPRSVCVLESDLCLRTVCDSEDKGDDFSAWAYKSAPMLISSNECEVAVTFPKEYKGANCFARIFLVAPDSLTGTGKQYVDLDRPLTDADGVEMVFSHSDSSQQACLFGSRSGASSQNFSALYNVGRLNIDFNNSNFASTRIDYFGMNHFQVYRIIDDCKHRVLLENATGVVIDKKEDPCGDKVTQPSNCRIFGMSSGAPAGFGNFNGNVYSFRVYETATGKTLYNLVPGKNADGEACFVDSLTGKTYENEGNGGFLSSFGCVSASIALPPLKPRGLVIFLGSALQL